MLLIGVWLLFYYSAKSIENNDFLPLIFVLCGKDLINYMLLKKKCFKKNKHLNPLTQSTWPASWETCMQVRKQELELDMEQQTGSQ